MNILYLCHRIPYPPDKGDKIRAHHYIRHLASRHAVHVACLIDDRADLAHRAGLSRLCASLDDAVLGRGSRRVAEAAALAAGRPMSVASFRSGALLRSIRARMRAVRFDAVIAQSAAMAEYVRDVRGIPRVMDFVDLDSAKWRTYAAMRGFPWSRLFLLEAGRLSRYEDEVASEFDLSIFISEREAALFQERVPGARIAVVPNGVDLEYFAAEAGGAAPGNAVVFTGVMDYFPNVDAMVHFCAAVFPAVRREVPDAEVLIVGRNPAPRVLQLRGIPGVTVTGEVSDTRPWMAKAKLAVAPFRVARGVQNKVLEAMAMGLPVVGTPLAFQGIPAEPGKGVEVAESPEGLAAAVAGLLRDEPRRRRQGELAREFTERRFRWDVHAGRLEELILGLSESTRGALARA